MKITDALLGEHGVFYAQFDRIEKELETGEGVEVLRGEALLLAAALAPHARLEDDLLFGVLEEKAGPEAGPVSTMRAEHAEIEAALDRATGAPEQERVREALLEAIHLARAHFLKEEQAAFPMAEEVLGPERLERLGAECASARGVFLAS